VIEYRRILCPVDFSDRSLNALRHATTLAARFEAELHLLNVVQFVVPFLPTVEGVASLPVDDWLRQSRIAAERHLAELPTSTDPAVADLAVVREIVEGTPFVEIVRYAGTHDVDLIVLGTHGRSGLSHMLLGSVAEKVVRKAPCAVLTVRPPDHTFEMP
jgi:nucleotide-binding universal stress UspA family protein